MIWISESIVCLWLVPVVLTILVPLIALCLYLLTEGVIFAMRSLGLLDSRTALRDTQRADNGRVPA